MTRYLWFVCFGIWLGLCLTNPTFSQPSSTENFAIKPGQSVYISAVKGDCEGKPGMMVVNGQMIIRPYLPAGNVSNSGQRKTLLRNAPAPEVIQALRQLLTKDRTFVVVDSPEQADFVFRVCATFTDDIMPAQAMQRMNVKVELAHAEARVIPAALYRANPEDFAASMWKAITPDAARAQASISPYEKKKKEKKPPSNGPVTMVNGVPLNVLQTDKAALGDLVKYFLQDYARIAAVSIPKIQSAAIPENEPRRPALTNKPDEESVEKSRPALGHISGAQPVEAKSETPAKAPAEADEILRVNTALVSVPVQVLDRDGKYIPDLTKQHFKVFEDKVEQEIEHFSNVDDPFHVVLLLDMSGSTRFKVEDIQDAALVFLEQLRPQDRVMVISFEGAVFIDAEFTNERTKLTKAILRTRTGGATRLYDAIDLVLTERLNRIQGRKAIVLFSDCVDTASRQASFASTLNRLEEANVLVYPIHYDTAEGILKAAQTVQAQTNGRMNLGGSPEEIKKQYEAAARYVSNLVQKSGGRAYEAATLSDAQQAFANIAEELRRQYWLSYYSNNQKNDGSQRKIRVTVEQPTNLPAWAVRAKDSYRAPKK
jgi:Ca-activated chloride channel homolog